jgi:hypothetical protein
MHSSVPETARFLDRGSLGSFGAAQVAFYRELLREDVLIETDIG